MFCSIFYFLIHNRGHWFWDSFKVNYLVQNWQVLSLLHFLYLFSHFEFFSMESYHTIPVAHVNNSGAFNKESNILWRSWQKFVFSLSLVCSWCINLSFFFVISISNIVSAKQTHDLHWHYRYIFNPEIQHKHCYTNAVIT